VYQVYDSKTGLISIGNHSDNPGRVLKFWMLKTGKTQEIVYDENAFYPPDLLSLMIKIKRIQIIM
jgi:hypothetical protein